MIPRDKNLDSLATLGLTVDNVKETILALTDLDYIQGPGQQDNGKPGEVWEFGSTTASYHIYIKLVVCDRFVRCLSFHEAERPLRFRFRTRT